jgi:hypothetical protein
MSDSRTHQGRPTAAGTTRRTGSQTHLRLATKHNVSGPDGETIINRVRDKFILAWNHGVPLPAIDVPAGRSQAEFIELCQPRRPIPDNPKPQLVCRLAPVVGLVRLHRKRTGFPSGERGALWLNIASWFRHRKGRRSVEFAGGDRSQRSGRLCS